LANPSRRAAIAWVSAFLARHALMSSPVISVALISPFAGRARLLRSVVFLGQVALHRMSRSISITLTQVEAFFEQINTERVASGITPDNARHEADQQSSQEQR